MQIFRRKTILREKCATETRTETRTVIVPFRHVELQNEWSSCIRILFQNIVRECWETFIISSDGHFPLRESTQENARYFLFFDPCIFYKAVKRRGSTLLKNKDISQYPKAYHNSHCFVCKNLEIHIYDHRAKRFLSLFHDRFL